MNICPCCKTSHDSTACPTPEPQGVGRDALLSRIEALRECLEEAVVITRGARIGTIGATRVHTPQINVKAVERWGRVLRDNETSPSVPQ